MSDEPYTYIDHTGNRLKIERGGSVKGRGATLATLGFGNPEDDWDDPVFVPAADVEKVAAAMFAAAGRAVVIADRVEEVPTRRWNVGNLHARLSSGEVMLSWGGGEFDLDADTAGLLGAALIQAAAALRVEPSSAQVEALAEKLALFDASWDRANPADRHYDQARQLLRTYDITEREATR